MNLLAFAVANARTEFRAPEARVLTCPRCNSVADKGDLTEEGYRRYQCRSCGEVFLVVPKAGGEE